MSDLEILQPDTEVAIAGADDPIIATIQRAIIGRGGEISYNVVYWNARQRIETEVSASEIILPPPMPTTKIGFHKTPTVRLMEDS